MMDGRNLARKKVTRRDEAPRTRPQTIKICRATVDETAEIFALVQAHALQGNVLPRPLPSIYNSIGDWLVAGAGGEILGCVSLLHYTSGLVEVRSLAVQGRYQGIGIGSRLVEATIKEARRRHIPTLFALTRKVPFFARLGFQLTDRARFPEKIWYDCQQCPFMDRCDETAMVLELKAEG